MGCLVSPLISNVVLALCSHHREHWSDKRSSIQDRFEDVDSFVKGQIAASPSYFRLPILALTLLIGTAAGLAWTNDGARIRLLAPKLLRLRSSRFKLLRDWLYFYEGLCLFALYSRAQERRQ